MTMKTLKIILASSSPYRRALLERLNLPFETSSPDIDETPIKEESPQATVVRLSIAKAQVIANQAEDPSLIIGSDQLAVVNGQVLGKPGNAENACRQLSMLSGNRVTFMTGLALVNSLSGHIQSEMVPFHVEFRELSDAEIRRYVDHEEPFNCAGSFKSEGLGISLFKRMEGDDPNALVGLPLIQLVTMLKNEGIAVP